ncbi:MAG: hypothetical protein RI947_102 [Candidatus Parcubacteria bacterium]|jgi:hypothetical protein
MKNARKNTYVIVILIILVAIIASIFKSARKPITDKTKNTAGGQNTLPTTILSPTPIALQSLPQLTLTPVNTSGWLTYTNEKAHINFRYPKDFTYTERIDSTLTGYPSILSSVHFSNKNAAFYFAASENFNKYSLEKALGKGPFLQYTNLALSSADLKVMTIGGVDSIIASNVHAYTYKSIADIIIIRKNLIYEFVIGNDFEPNNSSLLSGILSTIRFSD